MTHAAQGRGVAATPGPADSWPKVPAMGKLEEHGCLPKCCIQSCCRPQAVPEPSAQGWQSCVHTAVTAARCPQPAQLLLQGCTEGIKAGIRRFLSTRHLCSDTFLGLWAADPNKMMLLFLSSRIIWVASELLGASISQQKIEILCLSRNIFTSLLKNNRSFVLGPQQDKKKRSTTTTGF